MDEKVRKAFEESGISREITCEDAFTIAEKFKIPKMAIARYCNKNKIKIRSCQLGCFR